jgi:hypothetical protein
MWRILWALPVVAAVILVLAWLRPPAGRARFLRLSGLALTVMFLFGGAVWIAGEAFIDPGGLRAMALIAWWLVPLTVLSAIAWYRPALATGLLGALTAGVVGVSLWYAIDPGGWQVFEDDNGPVRAIGSFVLAASLGLLGWRRPLPAGLLLLAVGAVPLAVSAAGSVSRLGSLAAASVLPVLAGICYLLAGTVAARPTPTQVEHTLAARR